MKPIEITINNKIATVTTENAVIVCGNGDYIINFTFSEEWSEAEKKTARFIFGNNYYIDVNFTGNSCAAPIIFNTREALIGVYAGDPETAELKTSTPARVDCSKGVQCGSVAGTAINPVIVTKGEDGYTPQKGVDYWTDADISEMKSYIDSVILGGEW